MRVTNQPRASIAAIRARDGSLSEGMLVEASVLARVLGLKILRLEARVMLLPAEATQAAPAPTRAVGAPRPSAGAPRGHLADAVRSLHEGAAILDETRRNGTS